MSMIGFLHMTPTSVARGARDRPAARAMFEATSSAGKRSRPGPRETVALLAGLMALNAFAIDAMIPALPAIGADLGVAEDNRRQLVVVAYMLGFGVGQLLWGPLADRFGRKPILAIGVALYAGFALLCGIAASFDLLIAGRVAMGASAAVTRVLVVAMVRDLFEGEAMARVMSLVFMVFMLVPVLAPNLGQAILLVAPWRAIFLLLAGYGAADVAVELRPAARDAASRISPAARRRATIARAARAGARPTGCRSAIRWR